MYRVESLTMLNVTYNISVFHGFHKHIDLNQHGRKHENNAFLV